MNAHQDKPRLSAMLGQVATVARVTTSSLGLRRLDKQASKQSDRAHNAKEGTGKTFASRMAGAEERIKEVTDLGRLAQAELKAMTTVWGDGSMRLLANMQIADWLKKFAPIKRDYDAKLAKLIADAPMLIASAHANKGTYEVDVPTEEEMHESFSLEFAMTQIPDSASFAATGVEAQMQEQMRMHFERGIEAAYANATHDALVRVAEPLQHLVDRLAVYDQAEDEKARGVTSSGARLYGSTIEHVQSIAKVFRSFNLMGDKLMSDIADKLDAFEGVDIEDIKGSADLRKDLTKKASVILDGLRDLI
jgi:hypothetical protein